MTLVSSAMTTYISKASGKGGVREDLSDIIYNISPKFLGPRD